MASAFVLINAQAGHETSVLENVKKIKGVCEAYIVYGVYDIIALVKSKSSDELKLIVSLRIRKLKNILSTISLLVIE